MRVLPRVVFSLIGVFLSTAIVGAQAPKHRYSFDSDISDSIGGADGVVVDEGFDPNFVYEGGMIDLSANTGEGSNNIVEDAYVDLPNGIVTGAVNSGAAGAISFEWWATVAETHTWQRFGDFGTSNEGEDAAPGGANSSYVLVTPNSGRYGDGLEMTNHPATNAGEPNVGVTGPFPIGEEAHVVAVYDHNDTSEGPNGSMHLYLNGAKQGSNELHADFDMTTLDDNNNWLGRSQWPDPVFDGSFNEFRIYEQALSDEAVIVSAVGGPNSIADGGAAAKIGGPEEIKSFTLGGSTANQVFTEPEGDLLPGLGQSWYAVANPGSKEGVDAASAGNERAVPYFQAESGITWWSGSDDVRDVPKYPTEVDGVITGDNYTVTLDGEIMIPASGPIRFLDGVDDYTYLAIDTDRSGVAGDDEAEILINDNSWTNALSTGNGGAPIVEVDFQDIAEGGEWLAIEFNMAEGGGGDSGMLYWDALDEDDFFPLDQGEGVLDLDAAVFMIPDSHLRSPETPSELVSGDFVASLPNVAGGWEIDVNPADGTSDSFGLDNPDADIYTTILNVDGVEFHINALGDVSEGTSFQILQADTIAGTPTIATDGWSFDPATGSVVFGAVVGGIQGDLDGNGTVEFADFLILSNTFGNAADPPGSGADIDGDGTVAFADFLILSNNFGQSAAASSVPEPSGLALLSVAGLLGGLWRRRRR